MKTSVLQKHNFTKISRVPLGNINQIQNLFFDKSGVSLKTDETSVVGMGWITDMGETSVLHCWHIKELFPPGAQQVRPARPWGCLCCRQRRKRNEEWRELWRCVSHFTSSLAFILDSSPNPNKLPSGLIPLPTNLELQWVRAGRLWMLEWFPMTCR